MKSCGILSCFFSRPAPARVKTDEVIPLHTWDDNPLFRRVGLFSLMVFDGVLDPEKLRSGLETLDDGHLEYHIPAEFSQSRPAIRFSHVDYSDMSKDNHPTASKLPKPSCRPAVVGDPDETVELACGPECPTSIKDFLHSDHPMLGLHIVSFKDATLVTLHWLHVVSDAMGMKPLLDGWIRAMQGDEIPEQQGYDYDPLVELGKHPRELHVFDDKRMSTTSLIAYGLKNGYGITVGRKECRMVCIPGWFLEELRTTVLQEFVNAGIEKPFLTDNDVLVAWWSCITISHLPTRSNKPVAIQLAMSLRKTLSKDLLSPDKPFVSNCTSMANLLLSAKELKKRTVSNIAFQVRSAVNQQRTREQVESYQAMVLESAAPLPVLMGPANGHQIWYSNWTQAGLFEMDFSVAAVTPRETSLYASYISVSQAPLKAPESFVIVGKDMQENTWLCGYRSQGLWKHVERELEAWKDI
ncbi:family regulatory protein [Fusarium austroafricanum]|uniref:Family regulatory protein n=1 Tax=Fusarium austroafricanum TaxID=2364996 RepID=A0A8H4P027_9HYPO|nr:family regulatory protein [Fusarium austroafricanum]